MSTKKRIEAGSYIAAHLTEFGAQMRLNFPSTYRVPTANLPHDHVLDDEFWNEVGNRPWVSVFETHIAGVIAWEVQ